MRLRSHAVRLSKYALVATHSAFGLDSYGIAFLRAYHGWKSRAEP